MTFRQRVACVVLSLFMFMPPTSEFQLGAGILLLGVAFLMPDKEE